MLTGGSPQHVAAVRTFEQFADDELPAPAHTRRRAHRFARRYSRRGPGDDDARGVTVAVRRGDGASGVQRPGTTPAADLRGRLLALPNRQRAVPVLRHHIELSDPEIAPELHGAIGTVSDRTRLAVS